MKRIKLQDMNVMEGREKRLKIVSQIQNDIEVSREKLVGKLITLNYNVENDDELKLELNLYLSPDVIIKPPLPLSTISITLAFICFNGLSIYLSITVRIHLFRLIISL